MATLQNEDLVETTQSVVTNDFLMKALKTHDDSGNIVIKDFTVSDIGKPGDNYASKVISVTVEIEKEGADATMHLIIKHPPKNLSKEDEIVYHRRLFHNESAFYRDVIPAIIELQMKHGLKTFGPPIPLHIYSSVDKDCELIVLEDLRPKGYKMSNCTLNYEQCKLVMEELAKFHALGFVLKNGSKTNLQKFEDALSELIWTFPLHDVLNRSFKSSMRCIKALTSEENVVAATDKLVNISLCDFMTEQLQPIEPHALICHGDTWRNNMLFKCEMIDGMEVPVGVKLLDFQLTRYALPTTDLSYFFYTSTTRELRDNKLHNLLELYYKAFVQNLELFEVDYPDFSFEVLQNLYKQTALYGMVWAYALACFVFMERINAKTFTESAETAFLDFARSMEHTEEFAGQKFLDPIEEMIDMGIL